MSDQYKGGYYFLENPDQKFLIQMGGRGGGRVYHFKKHIVSAQQELDELRRTLACAERIQDVDPSFTFDWLDSLRGRIRQLESYVEFAERMLTGTK